MKQGFEDAFMDLQSEYISLCMEVCGDLADEIDVLIQNLAQYRDAILAGDAERLEALLREGRLKKEAIDADEAD